MPPTLLISAFSRLWVKNVTLCCSFRSFNSSLFRMMLPRKRETEEQVWPSRGLKAGMTREPCAGMGGPGDFRPFLTPVRGRSV